MEKTLNKQQLQAIKHKNGPLLVIAGAGTGKTTVITERVKFLIEKKLAKPEEILALTFTEKAAREMEERIDIALPYGYTNMWILTFHAFCERILRREALQIGMDPRFKLMTTGETVQLIRQNLFKFKLSYYRPLGNPYKFIDGMIQHFSRLQDEDIKTDEYLKWARKQEDKKWLELANAYRTYEELKIANGFMDFGDLITKTIKLFRDRPNVLKEYKRQFKYILIDEFQDTNFSQNELALILAKQNKTQNITVVGDDDQSVYRFRGAAISNIIQFRKNFPKTKVVTLTQNYRSTQEILDRAYELIQHNNPDRLEVIENVNKKLISNKKDGEKIEFIHTGRVENEAEMVAKEILRLVKLPQDRYEYRDFAILVRANNHAEPFIRALQRQGIPYQFLGPGKLFRQSEIVDLISYLQVLYDFDNSTAAFRIFSLSVFGVNSRDLAKISNFARRQNLSYFEAAEKAGEINISIDSKEKIKKIVEMVHKHLGLVNKESAGQILYYFLEETKLLNDLLNPENAEAAKRANNISKFFDKIKTYEVDHPGSTGVFDVVDYINLAMDVGESPLAADSDWNEINVVNILTVHSSKGLEFPVVFLVNLVAQRFPTIERREQIPIPDALIKEVLPTGDFHQQEERRLFYVGMTRAKDKLYFSAANFYGEAKREKKLSPFIFESLGKSALDADASVKQNAKIEQLSFLSFANKNEIAENKKDENNARLKINYLSYSQIETFEICPLHFKLKYILKIPTQPIAAASFGTSIHNTLRDFYESKKNAEKDLLKLFKKNWIHEGFLDKKQNQEFFDKGKKYLKDFYKLQFDKNKLPTFLEQDFVIPISKDLKVGGRIDRVDKLPDGTIEIWDYKTGMNVPTQKEIDRNLQLTIYALAAQDLFKKKPEKVKLSLYYFENQKKITTVRTKSDLIKAKEEILRIKKEIEKSEFKCSGSMLCEFCEFKMFCQADLE
ncbi:MAG TPA: ATP-dependent DNA helicase [Patescibacteria group bacterium]|nr:ATP-dependent DNA helicase [Patescibacteria group bacterium]